MDQIEVWLGLFGCLSGKEGGFLSCRVSTRSSRMRPLWAMHPLKGVLRMGRSTTLSAEVTLVKARLWKYMTLYFKPVYNPIKKATWG